MSLLQQAERYLANQVVYKARNAFLSTPDLSAIRKAAERADRRETDGSPKSRIDGRLIALKDNICTSDGVTTCGSRILENWKSPYSATIADKLEKAGAILCGKTNLDEFGMGSHSTYTAFGRLDGWTNGDGKVITPGGSSGGSGVAVATEQCWAALGTDTGGSIRLPANYGGIIGFKPSYGDISRHGVIAYANSLDTVGILAKSTRIAKEVYEVLSGYDPKDPTSLSDAARARISEQVRSRKPREYLRIGIPMEFNINELDSEVRQKWAAVAKKLQELGHEIYAVSIPSTELALSAYYLLAAAEASSNLAKYDGVRFGTPSESDRSADDVLYAKTRGERLGAEAKRRILLGSFSLSAEAKDNYFIQAQKVRRILSKDFDNIFALRNGLRDPSPFHSEEGKVDVLLSPAAPTLPPVLSNRMESSAVEIYSDDVLTTPASLAGLPSISMPFSTGETPADTVGMQLTAQYGDEEMVFRAAEILETMELSP